MQKYKKMTAPDVSVGADTEQPSVNKHTDIISNTIEEINNKEDFCSKDLILTQRKLDRLGNPNYLYTFSMTDLYQEIYQGRPPIIENLLYSGAYILAGAPKIGKSFLVAQIAYHVSTGIPLWNNTVRQGTVLYLALEDDFQRIQSRMFMMYGVEDTTHLHFATVAAKINQGLLEQLENFVLDYPSTKLIIIDTMQKIREVSGESYSYANDYEIIGKLKQFADKHSLCILAVHHTRKQAADDKFDTISGTTGLLGCADGSLLMQKKKRTSLEATIDIVGRDQGDQILYLQKDPDTQIWNLDHTETELHKERPDELLEAISHLLTADSPTWIGSASDLIIKLAINLPANTLSKRLNIQAGKLMQDYSIRYQNTHSRTGSCITLTLESTSV